jgi:hypothetical protein
MLNEMSDAKRDDPGFPRASARKDQNRTVNCFDGLTLGWIQGTEIQHARGILV